jgi:hypothetical protein
MPPPAYFPPAPPPAFYGTPPAALPPPPAHRQTPQTPTPPGAFSTPFVGKPVSALIIGNNFGLANLPPGRCCPCAITRVYASRTHRTFECPLKYWAARGACPGWTATGDRIPASWNGDDITPACQAEWRAFAASVTSARSMAHVEAKF